MTLSVPSALAAETSASMPPPADAEVAVAQSVPAEQPEPPELDEHPVTTNASATIPVSAFARAALTCRLPRVDLIE